MSRCCAFDRRTAVIGVLSALLVIAAIGVARFISKDKPPDEVPASLVAAELPVAPPPRELRIVTIPWTGFNRGFVGPGMRVDVVGCHIEGQHREVFTLLADLTVFAVNGQTDLTKQQTFPDQDTVSFAVNEKKARLIELAVKANCTLELLLRHPDAPRRYPTQEAEDAAYDKVLAMVKGWLTAPPPRAVER